MFDPEKHPHRRYNPLTGEWVLVSPHRTQRPWLGQKEARPAAQLPGYDPNCYLCPGNKRAGGQALNPNYSDTYVFTNDYPALLPGEACPAPPAAGLLQAAPVRGECRVLCFSPRHNLTLAEMAVTGIEKVVEAWAEQTAELGQHYAWVQVFENKGAIMGCSNPHPHGQIWASDFLPSLVAREDHMQRRHQDTHKRALLQDYLEEECKQNQRVVDANRHWVALVPYWAVWPFEMMLIPRRHVLRLCDLTGEEKHDLAEILKWLLTRYDNLFETSFPYSMGWHGAPFGRDEYTHWQLHAHFYPPLLRSAEVKKFMVGYEMLGEPQRDLTAEQAAVRLRSLPTRHYRQPQD